MTQTVVDVGTIVNSGIMDGGALELARDLVADYTGDYLFYHSSVSPDIYSLVLCDDLDLTDSGYTFSSADWYAIRVTSSSHSVPVSVSGSSSGGFGGFNNAGNYSGSFSGSFSLSASDPASYQVTFHHDNDGAVVVNPENYILYGALDDLPKLKGGIEYHAYTTNCIILGCAFFALFARIFKRVSVS